MSFVVSDIVKVASLSLAQKASSTMWTLLRSDVLKHVNRDAHAFEIAKPTKKVSSHATIGPTRVESSLGLKHQPNENSDRDEHIRPHCNGHCSPNQRVQSRHAIHVLQRSTIREHDLHLARRAFNFSRYHMTQVDNQIIPARFQFEDNLATEGH